jgi:hypothetical protein
MRAKELKRRMRLVREAVNREVSAFAAHGGSAGGMASEGYAGGYLQALSDVELALADVPNNGRYARFWEPKGADNE